MIQMQECPSFYSYYIFLLSRFDGSWLERYERRKKEDEGKRKHGCCVGNQFSLPFFCLSFFLSCLSLSNRTSSLPSTGTRLAHPSDPIDSDRMVERLFMRRVIVVVVVVGVGSIQFITSASGMSCVGRITRMYTLIVIPVLQRHVPIERKKGRSMRHIRFSFASSRLELVPSVTGLLEARYGYGSRWQWEQKE